MSDPCRYYAAGHCVRGQSCRFAHVRGERPSGAGACRFFLRGECAYGSRCRYDHVRERDPSSAAPPPPNALRRRVDRPEDAPVALVIPADYTPQDSLPLWAPTGDPGNGLICSICMEEVLDSKRALSDRRFGILQCDHVFCLACLRKWRATKDQTTARQCPMCRGVSHYVVPSSFFPDSADTKARVMEEYRQRLAETPCKYFDQGEGECPFGSSCFYKHAFRDGSLDSRRPRKYAHGDVEDSLILHRDPTLWDFLAEFNQSADDQLEERIAQLNL